MRSIKRLGIAYGRLGLSTDVTKIERRAEGVKAGADALTAESLPSVLRAAFSLGQPAESEALLEYFANDPTFDVAVEDAEVGLLAAAVLDYAIENETEISPLTALAVVTTAFGGRRKPPRHDALVASAQEMLAYFQGREAKAPANRTYSAVPKKLSEAIQTVANTPNNGFASNPAPTADALTELAKYAQSNALAAAASTNVALDYVRGLEQELKIYWWASGGWSVDAAKPFRRLSLVEAAVRCGVELAANMKSDVGLFAAPALIDQVLERGRGEEALSKELDLIAVASAGSNEWRRETFSRVAEGRNADLFPISAALGICAASDDADDWHPRLKRLTKLDVTTSANPVELGLQVYRERLLGDALA